MRINNDKDIRELQKLKLGTPKKTEKGLFSEQLQKKMGEKFEEKLKELIDEIDLIGRDLLRTKDTKFLKDYKKKVREFISLVNSKYEHKIIVSVDEKRGKEKLYHITERLNEELESLSEEILNNVKEHIRLAKSVDEIKGLMVDTFG